jgi:hypothetical protein
MLASSRDLTTIRSAISDYSKGPIAVLPAVLLIAGITAIGDLVEMGWREVLAVSLGATASMLLTTGFNQSLNRRGSACLAFDDRRSARHLLFTSWMWAEGFAVFLMAFLAAGVSLSGLASVREATIFGLTAACLSAIWLATPGLVLVGAQQWAVVGMVAGFGTGAIVDITTSRFTESHLGIAAIFGTVAALATVAWALNRRLAVTKASERLALPNWAYAIYDGAPYGVYGFLQMLFLMLAHALGWVGRLPDGVDWLSAVTSLELGMTASLLATALAGGVSDRTLRLMWVHAAKSQDRISGANPNEFGRVLGRFYLNRLAIYLAATASLSTAVYFLFGAVLDAGFLGGWSTPTRLGIVASTFKTSLLAYWLFGWGQFNGYFSLTLTRPKLAIDGLLPGIAVMLLVGLPICLMLDFRYAAAALVLGAAVFAATSTLAIRRLLRDAAYYYVTSL